MTGYVRQALANIQPNLNINSGDLNAEFNALQTAFDSISGHTHDGTVGSGGRVGRILLTGDTTFYVSASAGNDNNTGLTVGSPWKTIQQAWNILLMNYDLGGHRVIIQLAAGTYTTGLVASSSLTGQVNSIIDASSGTTTVSAGIIIQGDLTTPSNVFIQTSGSHCFNLSFGVSLAIQGVKISSTGTGGGFGISALFGAGVNLTSIEWAACDSSHMHIGSNGIVVEKGVNIISATGGANHYSLTNAGFILNQSTSYTVSGTPAFSGAFINATNTSVYKGIATFTGGATGTRYTVSGNAVIDTTGGGASFFPGDGAGSTATGGQYI